MSKKYDVVANIGKYQDSNGKDQYINRNVGSIIQTKQGYHKLVLDACFNPAALQKDDNGRVWLNLFEPKPKEEGMQQMPVSNQANVNQYAQAKGNKPGQQQFMDDELPPF